MPPMTAPTTEPMGPARAPAAAPRAAPIKAVFNVPRSSKTDPESSCVVIVGESGMTFLVKVG